MSDKNDKIFDDIDKFLQHGLYLTTRTIFIEPEEDSEDGDAEITSQSAINTIKKIHILDNYRVEDSEHAELTNLSPESKDGMINIFLNSPGGSVIDGLAIYDAIKACKNYVRCYVYGAADSIASIILQAADDRVISENSRIMIHNGLTHYGSDNVKNIDLWQSYTKKHDEICYGIYLNKIKEKHPNYRKQDLKRKMENDMIFHGQEAIDFGLADRLVKRGE